MVEVVDFVSRKLKLVERKKTEEETRAAETFGAQREIMLKALDDMRKLVEEGKLEGLVLIGRDPTTKYFLSHVYLTEPAVDRHDLYAYMGYLDALKLEMSDHAALAPFMNTIGVIEDPYAEYSEEGDL